MPDLSKYKTAHQLARQLLEGPDHIVVLPMPSFDMPGSFTAYPVTTEIGKTRQADGTGEVVTVSLMPDIETLIATMPPSEQDSINALLTGQTPADTTPADETPRTEGQ
jgi:hypothetical protein